MGHGVVGSARQGRSTPCAGFQLCLSMPCRHHCPALLGLSPGGVSPSPSQGSLAGGVPQRFHPRASAERPGSWLLRRGLCSASMACNNTGFCQITALKVPRAAALSF